jgi:hypothetical protein
MAVHCHAGLAVFLGLRNARTIHTGSVSSSGKHFPFFEKIAAYRLANLSFHALSDWHRICMYGWQI